MKHTARRVLGALCPLVASLTLVACYRPDATTPGSEDATSTTTTTESTSGATAVAPPSPPIDAGADASTTTPTEAAASPAPSTDAASAAPPSAPAASARDESQTRSATTTQATKNVSKRKKSKPTSSEPAGLSGTTSERVNGGSAEAEPPVYSGGMMTTEPGRTGDASSEADSVTGTTGDTTVDPTMDSSARGMATSEPTPESQSTDETIRSATTTVIETSPGHDQSAKTGEETISGTSQSMVPGTMSQAAANQAPVQEKDILKMDRYSDLTNPAKAYEPQSKYPDKTGSTSITGVDRSHAHGSTMSVFTDPTVSPIRDRLVNISKDRPLEQVDLEKYPPDRRKDFEKDMNARLDNLDMRIEFLQNDLYERPESVRDQYQDVVKNLETYYRNTDRSLKEVDRIPEANWDNYKSQFLNQVAELERTYDSVTTAMQ